MEDEKKDTDEKEEKGEDGLNMDEEVYKTTQELQGKLDEAMADPVAPLKGDDAVRGECALQERVAHRGLEVERVVVSLVVDEVHHVARGRRPRLVAGAGGPHVMAREEGEVASSLD